MIFPLPPGEAAFVAELIRVFDARVVEDPAPVRALPEVSGGADARTHTPSGEEVPPAQPSLFEEAA